VLDAEDGSAGKMYGGVIEIPDYRGDALMMSDVVIAEAAEGGTFARGSHTLALSPTQVFERGEFRIFYELYNVAPRARYRTEISVEPVDRGLRGTLRALFGRETPVVLAFDGEAPDTGATTLQELRAVQAPLPPGEYRLKVAITADGQRRPLVRERRFTIAGS
jgi:hypothetical protein